MAGPDSTPEGESFDASDEQAINDRKRSAGRRRKESAEFLAKMLAEPAGRNWMFQLLRAAHMFETSFVQGDQAATAFREGERNVGLRLVAEITGASPDAYVAMLREQGNA